MTEHELKKKIIGIVLDVPITGIKIREILGGEATANAISNALISAGIGDVSEYKHKAEVAERVIANILCADACYFCNEKHGDCNVQHHDYGSKECIDRLLRLAEKELQEEKEDE